MTAQTSAHGGASVPTKDPRHMPVVHHTITPSLRCLRVSYRWTMALLSLLSLHDTCARMSGIELIPSESQLERYSKMRHPGCQTPVWLHDPSSPV